MGEYGVVPIKIWDAIRILTMDLFSVAIIIQGCVVGAEL